MLDQLAIVLVKPKYPANIGAVARAMATMGLSDLCVVGGPPFRENPEALKLARHASTVLDKARHFQTLESCLADRHWVCGTTHQARVKPFLKTEAMELGLAAWPTRLQRGERLALLFGREDRGLNTEELAHCQQLVSISTANSQQSLNLAQAAMICCYHLHRLTSSDDESQRQEQEGSNLVDLEQNRKTIRHWIAQLRAGHASLRDNGEKLENSLLQAFSRLERQHIETIQFVFRKLKNLGDSD